MALPPEMLAQLGALVNAALAGDLATQAQLAAAVAPLTTQAQLAAAVAPLATQAQLAAMQAQLAATQAQLAAMPTLAQIQAAIAAALAPHNAPAIAAAAAATVQAIVASRAHNAHDRSDLAYAVVPRPDGSPPPSWPVGFARLALIYGPIDVVDSLLTDYGLPHGAPIPPPERRSALAAHIGTMR